MAQSGGGFCPIVFLSGVLAASFTFVCRMKFFSQYGATQELSPCNMGYLKLVFLLLVLAPSMSSCTEDCSSSTFDTYHVVNSDGALEFPLFHRDHACIQNHLNHRRSSGFFAKKDLPIDLIQDDQINNFLFLMPIKLGTPLVWNLVAVDTGSILSFVQCQPCISCHGEERAGQIFAPNKSESLRYVGCSEESCRTVQSALRLQSKACAEKENICLYSMTFGGASTYSVGKLVTDRLAIGQNEAGYSVPNFIFGCSLDTEYHQYEAGVFGFGAESFSFFEQLAPLVGYKAFSYCWPSDKSKTGYLSIGKYNRVGSASYTPLFQANRRPVYALKLVKVVANGITLVSTGSEMIVDSGAKWTVLLSDTFDQLNTVITKALDPLGYHPTTYRGPNYMCFEDQFFKFFSNWSALPAVELSFDMGGTLALQPKNSFYFDQKYGLCTYFLRDAAVAKGVQILGNSATRSVGVTFDIQRRRFAFRNGDC